MHKDWAHVDFSDGAVGAEGDVEGSLGVGDTDGDGAGAVGCGGCEEGGGDGGVVWRWVDADDGHWDCGGAYDIGTYDGSLVSGSEIMKDEENSLRCCL